MHATPVGQRIALAIILSLATASCAQAQRLSQADAKKAIVAQLKKHCAQQHTAIEGFSGQFWNLRPGYYPWETNPEYQRVVAFKAFAQRTIENDSRNYQRTDEKSSGCCNVTRIYKSNPRGVPAEVRVSHKASSMNIGTNALLIESRTDIEYCARVTADVSIIDIRQESGSTKRAVVTYRQMVASTPLHDALQSQGYVKNFGAAPTEERQIGLERLDAIGWRVASY